MAITLPDLFDTLGHPLRGGLYDPALGPIDKNARCATCQLSFYACPGHFGRVELPVMVYYPPLFGTMFQVLRTACQSCHRLRGGPVKTALLLAKLCVLDEAAAAAAIHAVNELDALLISSSEDDSGAIMDADALVRRLMKHAKSVIAANPCSLPSPHDDSPPRDAFKSHDAARPHEGTNEDTSPSFKEPLRSGFVAQTRRKIVMEFLKRAGPSGGSSTQCQHCRAHIPSLHRHANAKIFQMPVRKGAMVAGVQSMVSSTTEPTTIELSESSESGSDDEEAKLTKHKKKQVILEAAPLTVSGGEGMKYMTPLHVHDLLARLWSNEHKVLTRIFGGRSSAEGVTHAIFFTEIIAVPPSRFRPPAVFGDQQFDHPQNGYLAEIIRLGQRIVELQRREGDFGRLVQSWLSLQEQVNYFADSSRAPAGKHGKLPPAGIKQLLEKKEGLFRKHMMGKRVNYAARSVISPDPNIGTDEIGVPLVFARKLTFPEPVTGFNLGRLQESVTRGSAEHPGATHVQHEDGTLLALETLSPDARRSLAKQLRPGHTVLRHIRNGDAVLMNRQPTLHKPSMMAHRVRILPHEKTLRMHYANCNTYNADFDGDEMNLHFHQSEMARAEAYTIAANSQQYLVPTNGGPLRGLIQDHIVTGVLLCLKDTWLDREDYQQLLFGSLPDGTRQAQLGITGSNSIGSSHIRQLPPAILYPKQLWSGKQVVATVLLNLEAPLNLAAKGKVKDLWTASHADEAFLTILDGYVCTGVLDKAQLGAAEDGLTHALYELYGPEMAAVFLTTMARLLTRYDQMIGFTCRMDDLLLRPDVDAARRRKFADAEWTGRTVAMEYAAVTTDDQLKQGMEQVLRHDELLRGMDNVMKVAMNRVTSDVIRTCLPDGLLRPFPTNNMSLMTQTGAKGSIVNSSQISGCLGQQELEGRRVPIMVSGKTLPVFPAWDPRARAGGYIAQRFLTGIRPPEFFFHCMAGREGLIDTAVKTSRSGYLQRCLVKHLESLRVAYDGTVRDSSDQSVIQFAYGEDGLDVSRQKCLARFPLWASNVPALIAQCRPTEALERVDTEGAHRPARKALKHPARHPPVMSTHNPHVYLGSCSERFSRSLDSFLNDTKHGQGLNSKQFRALLWLKYQRALVEPGEAVGLLAAQSIGEPSTQMTLNTFHFAGFGAKNVTLGIPRLREIIMTASQRIKTPTMIVKLLPSNTVGSNPAGDNEKKDTDLNKLGAFADSLSRVSMENAITGLCVSETLSPSSSSSSSSSNGHPRTRIYHVKMQFDTNVIDSSIIKRTLENQFVTALIHAVDHKKGKKASTEDLIATVAINDNTPSRVAGDEDAESLLKPKKKNNDFEEEEEDEDEEEGEEDASAAKATARRKQHASYEDDDKEDEEQRNSDVDEVEVSKEIVHASFAEGARMGDFGHTIRNYRWSDGEAEFELHFPVGQARVLLLDLIERIAPSVVLRHIPGITSAVVIELDSEAGRHAIQADGINFAAIWDHPAYADIDYPSIMSNDIGAILRSYGVEAARAAIVREIAGVFAVYGIAVDTRHLFLIADYMTAAGQYRPFNRQGMETATASPLLKMTFETTVSYLIGAAMLGDVDELKSPAARIVMGLPVQLGTGAVEIRQPVLSFS